jgi:hypothetical protein
LTITLILRTYLQIHTSIIEGVQKYLNRPNFFIRNLGYKELKAPMIGPARANYYKFHDLRMMFPFVNNWDSINDKKEKYQNRKMRIFMRGVKIGNRKGGSQVTSMSVFEMQGKKKMADPAAAQKLNEEAIKAGFTDDSLGLTSDA